MSTRLFATPFVFQCFLLVLFLLPGCAAPTTPAGTGAGEAALLLPDLEPVALDGRSLQVVATTSIIGDVLAQVGGDAIQLNTLIAPGQDAHSFEPAARDLTAVSSADVIFVNGWDLEEGLVDDLHNIGAEVPVVAVSAGITPLSGTDPEHEAEAAPDPHVWLSVTNVIQWVDNISIALQELDPANSGLYTDNAAAYRAELEALDQYARTQLAGLPAERRNLVTNHDALSYMAQAYDLHVLGTVIPGVSTLAEPSAKEMAGLLAVMREHEVCTIFTDLAVSDTLAQTVAGELDGCDQVQVLPLYTGSIGPAGSNADSYIDMVRTNVDTIVKGLQ